MKYEYLTIPQQNIWNLQKFYKDTGISNLCGAVFYREKRDSALLQQAIRQFIKNQSALRLRFCEKDGPRQYVEENDIAQIPILYFASRREFDSYAKKLAKDPVGLTDCSMYRFAVFEVENRSGILILLSHLIADAWTFGLMLQQLEKVYRQLQEGEEVSLPESDYRNYIQSEADYLHSERYEKDREYWEKKYENRPEESSVRPQTAPARFIAARRIMRILPTALEQKIRRYCLENSVTQAVLFETTLIVYLSGIHPENKTITIGLPVLNRSSREEKDTAGMFVTTMPFTVDVSGEITVAELTGRISMGHMEMYRHQKYPYTRILKYLREKQNFTGNLYDVMLSYQNAESGADADTQWYGNGYSEVPLAIHIDNRDGKECHTVNVDYQTEVFSDEAEVVSFIDRLEYILEQITSEPSQPVKRIGIVPPAEWRKLIDTFNNTHMEYPKEKCIHELFSQQVARTPDKTALVSGGAAFTYRQLDEMSNALAHFLRKKGVVPGEIVPLIAKRSYHAVTAMLGILKAGGAYMPIDPDYPIERIHYMLAEAGSRIGVTYGYQGFVSIETVELEDFDFSGNSTPLSNANSPEDTCYVIFTSGSTGKPKGVEISHRNLANFTTDNAKNTYQHYAVKNGKVMLACTVFSFDISVFEIFMSLLNGLCVVLAGENEINSPEQIANLIKENDVDVLHCTPTKIRMFLSCSDFQEAVRGVKVLMIGAEELTCETYHEVSDCTDAAVFNGYGPTETTVGVAFQRVTGDDITIGRPIANTQIYILNQTGTPCPIGVPGELCIAGEGVGKGYLNRPELTAEKFVSNPFANEENGHGRVMYRTGDLARFREDGEIEYLGRMDTQVKIRGLRIELGEIESVMSGFAGIGLTAAVAKRDKRGRQYLVGYYTSEEEIDEKELRRFLERKLPSYMVPNYFLHLAEMPMTPSGKINRKNLPEPVFAEKEEEYTAPETDTEKKLAEIWAEILSVERVGRNWDFLEYGGDSLRAIQMLGQIEECFNRQVEISDIMENRVLWKLASCIEEAPEREERILSQNRGKYLLTPQQKAIYIAYRKAPDSLVYNIPLFLSLPEDADVEMLKKRALSCLKRHPALRTAVLEEEGEIFGIIREDKPLIFETYERREDFIRPFCLKEPPLMRIGFRPGEMALDLHHIVCDGESLQLILKEILMGQPEPETVSYGDYADYFYRKQKSGGFGAAEAYYRELFPEQPEPVFLPHTGKPKNGGAVFSCTLASETVEKVHGVTQKYEVTETCVYLSAYGILLAGFSGRQNPAFSVILSNRMHAEIRHTIGMFVNTLPMALCLSKELTITEYMEQTRHRLDCALRYQELPFLDACGAAGIGDKSVFSAAFVYQPGEKRMQEAQWESVHTGTSKMDLTFQVIPGADGGCRIEVEYDREQYEGLLMERLAKGYEEILCQIADGEKQSRISDFRVMGGDEYRKIILDFNQTVSLYPREKCIHELFSQQVARTPDKTALVSGGAAFTYRQLDEMSNALAHFLRKKGVVPGEIVPLIAKRSYHAVTAMLGILKAGGAYMPIDPDYPIERINYMLAEAGSRIGVTYGYQGFVSIETVELEDFDFSGNSTPLSNANSPEDTCYVIFTSGSTGKPKGALLKHSGLVNLCCDSQVFYDAVYRKCGCVLAIGAFTFDISISEMFPMLVHGGKIVLADEQDMSCGKSLAALMLENQVDLFCATPTRLRYYLEHEEFQNAMAGVKVILSAGEAFSSELYDRVRGCTDGEIYNGYGPTETTVGATFTKVKKSGEITVGKPIANTQIYILNQTGTPCPIGVPGELCIAGEGVGKGYLNRPELTAEKFVSNPFANEENGHGKIMYRTGDLARFREDGEIEYLGRMDTQVKIRGLRIELGEIESVMSGFAGISLTAVVAKRDKKGRQYLVGYYTSEEEIDEKKLREYLSQKLPRYMIPNCLMRLEAIPMTSGGKTDRKNLPEPDFGTGETEYEAPVTEKERVICEAISSLLEGRRTGRNDDFFEIGGDSLLAMMLTAVLSDRGVAVSLQDIYEHPTPAQLGRVADQKQTGHVEYRGAEFQKYAEILKSNRQDVSGFRPPERRFYGNVLLTGATGFLGAHLLEGLIERGSGRVYCLVRDASKLEKMLEYYFDKRYAAKIGGEILLVEGDVADADSLRMLPEDVETVIHAAAIVKHYGEYSEFERVNVTGTRNLLAYAEKIRSRFALISTTSVGGAALTQSGNGTTHFTEQNFYIGQDLENVYVRSKFEAERLVLDAMAAGGKCRIFRMGNLTNRYRDGVFQPNFRDNAFLRRILTFLDNGMIPDVLAEETLEMTPVDLAAEAVLTLEESARDWQTVFHIANIRKAVTYRQLAGLLGNVGVRVSLVDAEEFLRKLKANLNRENSSVINEMYEMEAMRGRKRVQTDNAFTDSVLSEMGFCWADISTEYLRKYVEFIINHQ